MTDNLFAKRFAPGHFHSPLPDMKDLEKREDEIFNQFPEQLHGINLNEEVQLKLFSELSELTNDILPYKEEKTERLRFYHGQSYYSYKDATIYSLMIRKLRPNKIIEVGCGHSSHIALDTDEFFLGKKISFTFIEPNPQRFLSGLAEDDISRISFIENNVQGTKPEFFESLEANDILFIDSSHVVKTGGDINYLVFEVFPRLKSGVYIHIHDIFYHFEYLKEWVYEGRAWSEAYLMRAFLQYNSVFQIQLFTSWLWHFHRPLFEIHPFLNIDKGSRSSLWLRKM